MSSMLSQIIIILLLVIVVLAALKIFGIVNPDGKKKKSGNDTLKPEDRFDDNATKRAPEWKIELIDYESGKVIKDKLIPGLKGNDSFTIGREDCDFIIPVEYVSRKNAKIISDGARYILRPQKNSAEIYHNGKKIEEIVIQDGLVLKMAKMVPIRFVEVSSEDLIHDAIGDSIDTGSNDHDEVTQKDVINPRF